MRLFVAITLDKAIRKKLSDIQSALKEIMPDVRLVEPDNIHLTLRFLGEVEEGKLPELIKAVSAVENYPAFDLELKGIGVFPVERHPKVVWARGIDSGNTLEKIYSALEKELLNIDFQPDDHKFSAHITLGRNKTPKYNDRFQALLNEYAIESFGTQKVIKVSLLKSTLTPEGPIYTNIRDFSLGK